MRPDVTVTHFSNLTLGARHALHSHCCRTFLPTVRVCGGGAIRISGSHSSAGQSRRLTTLRSAAQARVGSIPVESVRFADGGFQGFPESGMLTELSANDTFSLVVVDGEWSFASK